MEHHRLAVRGQLNIQLDAITARAGGLEGGQRVFRRPAGRPEAAMSDGRIEQQLPGFTEGCGIRTGRMVHQKTSTTASTSTAKPRGSL